jgi:hypothetical protein
MPMLLLNVSWCLPLTIPSSKIVLPTQKLTSYLSLKLITNTPSYPKTQPKTHNPHASLPINSTKNSQPTCYPSQKHTCEMMLSPSEVVGWDCGACAYINKDAMCCNCLACQARLPVGYAIVAGATVAAMVRTMRVNCCKQARVATLPTAGPVVAGEAATSANGAVAGEAPNAAYGGHLLWRVVRPCTTGGLPNWGTIVQAFLLGW